MSMSQDNREFTARRRKARWTAAALAVVAVLIFVVFLVTQTR